MTRPRVAALVVVLLAVASGCGDDQDVVGEAETGIAAMLADRLDTPVSSIAVTCPEDLVLEPGRSFSCGVRVDTGAPATADVQIELAVADDGTIGLQRAVIPADAARDYLAQELAPTAEGPVAVDCGPDRLLVRSVGESFECIATRAADGVQFRVIVDVIAVDGTVDYRVERTTTTAAP